MKNAPITRIHARYDLLEKLGEGGMGVVYRAHDRLRNQQVALKQVKVDAVGLSGSTASATKTLQIALAREFRTLAGLRHPNIVSVLDYGFYDQRPFYTMQFLDNASPIVRYAANLESVAKVLLVIEMLQAIAYLHQRRIIHRDLKPQNVLVSSQDQVKVMDFGVALAPHLLDTDVEDAQARGLVGTLGYIAPEQFKNEPASIASDLYAVGVMIFELFAGHHPFNVSEFTRYLAQIMRHEPDLSLIPAFLRPIVKRLLAKDPAVRHSSASDLIHDLYTVIERDPPPESPLTRESYLQASNFIGRDSELQVLTDALRTCMNGESRMWLMGGESGVGKSRLLDELRTIALVEGALVLRGQAAAEGGLAYQLWRQVIRPLLLMVNPTDTEASILKPIVPDIATLLERDVNEIKRLPGEAEQQRLKLTLVDLFKRRHDPLVLLLEDLQWAEESLIPLQHLLSVLDQVPRLLVIATYRSDERPDLPKALPTAQQLELHRFDNIAIAALSEAMLGTSGQKPEIVSFLQRETEGNVFFIVETLRALAQERGSLSAIGQSGLPESIRVGGVQQIIQRRLNQIPAAQYPLLKLAAVAGRNLELPLLAHITSSDAVQNFLVAGEATSILQIEDDAWRFSHDKLREHVLANLSDNEQRTYNRMVAEAIEALHPDDDDYLEALFWHWHITHDVEQTLKYAVSLAHQSVHLRPDYQQAIRVAKIGLDLIDHNDVRYPQLLLLTSTASREMGEWKTAQDHAKQALEAARALGVDEVAADSLRVLATIAKQNGDFERATEYIRESTALCRRLDALHGIAAGLNTLGSIARAQGDFDEAQQYHEQGLVIYRQLADQPGTVRSLNNLGIIASIKGNYREAITYMKQALALSYDFNNRYETARILNNIGVVQDELGDYNEAEAHYLKSLDLRHQLGDKMGIASSSRNLSTLAVRRGDYQAARQYAENELAIMRTVDNRRGIAEALANLSTIVKYLGELTLARSYATQSLEVMREIGDKSVIAFNLHTLGTIAVAQTEYPQAEEHFNASLELRSGIGDKAGQVATLTELFVLKMLQKDMAGLSLLKEALTLSLQLDVPPLLLGLLLHVAELLYYRGGDYMMSAELLGAVEAHPAVTAEHRQYVESLRGKLGKVFDSLQTAVQVGQVRELKDHARHLLNQAFAPIAEAAFAYEETPPSPSVARAVTEQHQVLNTLLHAAWAQLSTQATELNSQITKVMLGQLTDKQVARVIDHLEAKFGSTIMQRVSDDAATVNMDALVAELSIILPQVHDDNPSEHL